MGESLFSYLVVEVGFFAKLESIDVIDRGATPSRNSYSDYQ